MSFMANMPAAGQAKQNQSPEQMNFSCEEKLKKLIEPHEAWIEESFI
jgi:hypothetical protein